MHGAGVSSRELRPLAAELGERLPAWTVWTLRTGSVPFTYPMPRPLPLDRVADALTARDDVTWSDL
ncbi:hypothetical protein [Nonomuraea sp. NPDC049725]|uniref:hypothetical protein n=1 Tax=Nonomuraea sp. NPDC049725 TaxID=3154508 RepID=UPI00342F128A